MEMSSAQSVPATQEQTWRALNDPEILKACIPGCESMEKVSDTEYRLAMTVKVGPVKAKFNGKMLLANLKPPSSYTVTFEGQGGAAGFAKGTADVALAPEAGGTQLKYTVKAQVGGKLAQIGSRLIDGAAKKMADDFFGTLVTRLGGTPQAAVAAAQAAEGKAAAGAGANAVWWWVALAIVVVVILYFLLR